MPFQPSGGGFLEPGTDILGDFLIEALARFVGVPWSLLDDDEESGVTVTDSLGMRFFLLLGSSLELSIAAKFVPAVGCRVVEPIIPLDKDCRVPGMMEAERRKALVLDPNKDG